MKLFTRTDLERGCRLALRLHLGDAFSDGAESCVALAVSEIAGDIQEAYLRDRVEALLRQAYSLGLRGESQVTLDEVVRELLDG